MAEIALSTENVTVAAVWAATILAVEWLDNQSAGQSPEKVAEVFNMMFKQVNERYD